MLKVFEKEKLVYEYEKQCTSEHTPLIFNLFMLDFKKVDVDKMGNIHNLSKK